MTPDQIAADARTVTHLAAYLDELKAAAGAMIREGSAGRRGYFTPGEDEQLRRLQVSYWTSRGALFEVVNGFRADTELPEPLRPAAFLVAYAAAVLLVDAARFLRENFGCRRVVRQKLNEPEPQFGIPKGTYDTIQKSLTSTRHAWHLYHAMHYYEDNADTLRALASDKRLAPVVDVLDRLEPRLRVAARTFINAKLRVRARRTASRLRYGLLGRALYGLQKMASSMAASISTRPSHQSGLPRPVADELKHLLRPGDVLITRKRYVATNYFLPGYWKHAALYLGDWAAIKDLGIAEHENVRPRWSRLLASDGPYPDRVLEAMRDGVRVRSLASPYAVDAIAVLRPSLDTEDIATALTRGMFHEGKPYDFDFDFTRSDRLVCTEVVYRAYDGIGPIRFTLTRRAGRLNLSAEDLVGISLRGDHFVPVAAFAPDRDGCVVTGDAASATLDATTAGGGDGP